MGTGNIRCMMGTDKVRTGTFAVVRLSIYASVTKATVRAVRDN